MINHQGEGSPVMKRTYAIILFLLVGLAACAPQPASESRDDLLQAGTPSPGSAPVLRVAYSKNAAPWVWTDAEGGRQLAQVSNVLEVVISDDGEVVVFKREDSGELLAVNGDGSNLHVLVGSDFLAERGAAVWRFDFAPHSHDIYLTLNTAGGAFQPFYDLQRVNADEAQAAPELVLPAGEGGIATFSPDGAWMAVYHPGGLDLVSVGSRQRRTVFTYPEGYEPATFGPQVVWMEDSSGFALYHTPDPMTNPYLGGLWFVPVEGEAVERTAVANTWGIPSPDGERLGFHSTEGMNEIRIVEADGTISVYGVYAMATFTAWAPDSEHFIITVDEEVGGRVVRMPYLCLLGEEPVRLADAGSADPVVWVTGDGFLYASWGDLRLQRIGMPSLLLDEEIYNLFDYAWVVP
jgi:hypothetical protein